MINQICVIGQPSLVGGADTELMDQCLVWSKMGLKIYFLPTQPLTKLQEGLIKKLNGICLERRQWQNSKGFHCIGYCNGAFLENLHHIKKYAKTTTFVNCMTWNFQKEIECQSKNLIDFHLYQTDHQLTMVSRNLQKLGTYRPLRFTPYFETSNYPYWCNRPNDHFRYGRISRSDPGKFNIEQLKIYNEFTSPVQKSGVILGWDKKIETKFLGQKIPDNLQLIKAGGVSSQDFYKFCDVLCSKNDTFENLPRVGFEAMSSGSVLVVDKRGGWILQIEDGKTGFLCSSAQEFIDKMSFLAHNPDKKEEMRRLARERLLLLYGTEESILTWEIVFSEWEKLR